jgi:hypothetical protein
MIYDGVDRLVSRDELRALFFEYAYYSKEFLIVDIVVTFC